MRDRRQAEVEARHGWPVSCCKRPAAGEKSQDGQTVEWTIELFVGSFEDSLADRGPVGAGERLSPHMWSVRHSTGAHSPIRFTLPLIEQLWMAKRMRQRIVYTLLLKCV